MQINDQQPSRSYGAFIAGMLRARSEPTLLQDTAETHLPDIPPVGVMGERAVSRSAYVLGIGALILFLALSIGFSYARAPWWDEGMFADASLHFRNVGHLGSPTLDPNGYLNFPAARNYTYWQFPVYLVSVGAWFHLVPASAENMRLFSVIFGCLYCAAWFLFTRAVSGDSNLAVLVASVIAVDYSCISAASNGRMDMMCVTLGQSALAAYVTLRERNWNLAATSAALFCAAALFCHPMGLISNLTLAVLVIIDKSRIRWQGLITASLPFFVGGALYFRYVLQAPHIWLAQMRSASGYRVNSFAQTIKNLSGDFYGRYFWYYCANLPGLQKVKIFCLLFGVAGVVSLILSQKLRALPISRILLLLAGIAYIGVSAIDNQYLPVYFVYSVPVFSACGAVWVYNAWKKAWLQRILPTALLLLSVVGTVGAFSYKIHQDDYRTMYLPVVDLVRRVVPPGTSIMGGSELGFALGFGSPLRDDRYLGFFSGVKPDVFVENPYYGRADRLARTWFEHQLASNFHLIYANRNYKVYLRKSLEASARR